MSLAAVERFGVSRRPLLVVRSRSTSLTSVKMLPAPNRTSGLLGAGRGVQQPAKPASLPNLKGSIQ